MPSKFFLKTLGGVFYLAMAISYPVCGQSPTLDSLLNEEANIISDTGQVNLYNEISWQFLSYDQNNFLAYAECALDLAEKTQFPAGIVRAKNLIAIDYSEKGNSLKSIDINLEALKLAEKHELNYAMLTCYNDLGISYSELGEYEKSLAYYQKVLEKETDPISRYKTYSNLSYLYLDMGNPKEADKYLKLGMESAKNSKDPQIMATMFLDRGYLEETKKDYEKALEFFEMARTNAIKIQDRSTQLYAGTAIAEIYFKQEEYAKSLLEVEEAHRLHKLLGSVPVYYYIFLSDVYIKLGRFEEGVPVAQIALKKARTQKQRPILPQIYKILAEGYLGLKQFPEAIDAQSHQMLIQDSLNSENNAETLAKLEAKFKLKEKEAENQLLKKEGEVTEQELALTKNVVRQQKIITAGTILGLLVASGLLFYVFRLLKTVRLTNQQLKEQSEHLKAAKIKAESAAKAKSEFLSVMSHEIRTPMNAVIGMTHLLMDDDPRQEQIEHLNVLQFSGNNLIALINDILDFSKIEAGKLALEQVEFDLKKLVQSITASMQIKGSDKGIEVKYTYDKNLSDFYIGDSVRLGQILINLMGNAVKFTEQGFVELQVHANEKGNVVFQVIDTGIGIPKSKQSIIFESFSQSSEDTTRKFGGTGLGLTISRRLVDLMGSELKLESIEGEGSVFFFEASMPAVEMKKSAHNKAEKPKYKLKFGSLQGAKILIAEDNKTNQIVARKFLEKWDAEVEIVDDGLQAVEAWKAGDFDLILMDVQMPVMEGTDACKMIRQLEEGRDEHIAILGFTASVVENEINRLYECGMDDWVSKPFDPAVLFQKIDRFRRVRLPSV